MGSILSPVIDDDDDVDDEDNIDDHTGGRGDSGWTVSGHLLALIMVVVVIKKMIMMTMKMAVMTL